MQPRRRQRPLQFQLCSCNCSCRCRRRACCRLARLSNVSDLSYLFRTVLTCIFKKGCRVSFTRLAETRYRNVFAFLIKKSCRVRTKACIIILGCRRVERTLETFFNNDMITYLNRFGNTESNMVKKLFSGIW